MNLIRSLIARLAIQYALRVPDHRGRFRLFSLLDKYLGPFCLKTPAGPVLEVYLSSSMDLSYFRRHDTAAQAEAGIDQIVPRLIGLLQPGECFVDIGANIGWLSCLASAKVGPAGRVIAVEPSPREYTRLLHGLALNRAANIIPVHGAFGADNAVGTLAVAGAHTGLNHLAAHPDSCSPEGAEIKVQVPVWTGDSLLPSLVGTRQVGLVKIDTEGAELLVLSGMQQFLATMRPRHVAVEITPKFLQTFAADKSAVYALMTGLGFRATVNSASAQYDEVFVPR